MRQSAVRGVRLAGLASAVPDGIVANTDEAAVFGEAEVRKIIRSTGIKFRRMSPPGFSTSDLCLAAVDKLLPELNWAKDSIDALIFVSQTSDYYLPATSCSLHGRLGLATHCASFDVSLGCSGWVYGLWLSAHLIASQGAARVLLLAGDLGSRRIHPLDRSAKLLFGDAGTATAIEAHPNAPTMSFRVGTDGGGQNQLMIPAGGVRLPVSPATGIATVGDDGNTRTLNDLFMDGAEVFLFTLERIPPLIEATLKDAGWTIDDVDAFVFHQANRFMLEHLGQAMNLPPEKLVLALEEYGNTSSASVPLAITARLAEQVRTRPMKLILAGFGVGYSWASAAVQTDALVAPDVVIVNTQEALRHLTDESKSHLPVIIQRQIRESGS